MISSRLLRNGCRRLLPISRGAAAQYAAYSTARSALRPLDTYKRRHNGTDSDQLIQKMVDSVGYPSVDKFVEAVVPPDVLFKRRLNISPSEGFTESQLLERLREIASKNKVYRSYIGKGYYGTIVPGVIQRNILECPEWYTSYTPYQPEIAQGRLESLLNYQTLVADLTGMEVANASLLDEGTAAAEAMIMSAATFKGKNKRAIYYVDSGVHDQTVAVLKSRASPLAIEVKVGLPENADDYKQAIGALVQYPSSDGSVKDWSQVAKDVHAAGGLLSAATDLLALTVLESPHSFGADIALGNSQRFGVPFGYGGPHAAFFAVANSDKRKMPGRLVGKSKDRLGDPAYRLALQTREQHIRRENATSNICTAQALLANMAAMYAVYHGPEGLKEIANRVHTLTKYLASAISSAGYEIVNDTYFDTLTVKVGDSDKILKKALETYQINLNKVDQETISLSLDETVSESDLKDLISIFSSDGSASLASDVSLETYSGAQAREATSSEQLLKYPVFNQYHTETEMLRYIHHLQSKDLSLANSMIPLGSCTMKLNATTEMIPITWPEFGSLHPFAPLDQAEGYKELIDELEADLSDITGFDAVSLQPNSGAQGEYTGLRVIRAYLESKGEGHRNICLIPVSAHGTNPASAAMSGMKVVAIKCTSNGELDLKDLEAKIAKHGKNVAAIMITYPSTFGAFEPTVKKAIELIHNAGGQVYMDGANMNAQIGLTSPGEIGADVCHLNLHKTFCIPHGGGGPGVGPIGVKEHLTEFLPGHNVVSMEKATDNSIAAISAAPWGSAGILPIPWAYIKMMGSDGLKQATELALLNANYMKEKLAAHYPILYTNENGRCAHEFIIDARQFKATAGIEAIDIAKRLQDYGFHAPTMSWPVANTLMIEPTESESIQELDRFCEALISIRKEIADVESGAVPKENNVLKNAPHSAKDLLQTEWDRPYTRELAAYPLPYLRDRKFWPSVTRLDDTYGDVNLFCSCDKVEMEE